MPKQCLLQVYLSALPFESCEKIAAHHRGLEILFEINGSGGEREDSHYSKIPMAQRLRARPTMAMHNTGDSSIAIAVKARNVKLAGCDTMQGILCIALQLACVVVCYIEF